MKLKLGLLLFVGSMALVACGDSRKESTQNQVAGEPCSVEGQQSECAKDGFPAACVACQGQWLSCLNGKWISVHCDPMQRDAAVDLQNAADAPSDISSTLDNRGAIDTAPLNSSTDIPLDAAADTQNAADVPPDLAANLDGRSDADSAVMDGSDG